MKILFVTGVYPRGMETILLELGHGTPLSIAANTFQWAIIDGFVQNETSFQVVSYPFLSCFPLHFKTVFTPAGNIIADGCKVGTMEPFMNVSLIAETSIRRRLKKYVIRWAEDNKDEDQLVALVYSPCSMFVEPLISLKKRYKNLRICAIVTDLADDYNNNMYDLSIYRRVTNSIEVKKIKKSYAEIDSFVLLTEYMEEMIPDAVGKNIVIEGVCSGLEDIEEKQDTRVKTLLYTGSLGVHTSVDHLVDAFMQTKDPDFKLLVCGGGDLEDYVIAKSKIDSRIEYKGILPRHEVLKLQKNATAVINPRKPSVSVTRYSFPSKTMEYMASGTPLIGYKLEGIPAEYYQHFYAVQDESISHLTQVINNVLSLPQAELNTKARQAYDFIKDSKSAKTQVEKIITFLNGR